jgi:hypothetical protein
MYSLPLDIQLSRGGWNPINQFNPATSNSNTQFDNAGYDSIASAI